MTARGNPEKVEDDYWALVAKLRGTRAHMVLSLAFLAKGKSPGRSRCIQLPMNTQLHSSHHQQRYLFFDCTAMFEKGGGFPKLFVQ